METCSPLLQTFADEDLLLQAMLNVIGNAIKYTPEGGSVRVCCDLDEEAGELLIRITDTGVGIPPADLPRLFDKFYRVAGPHPPCQRHRVGAEPGQAGDRGDSRRQGLCGK